MANSPEWPPYPVGDHKSIFALGVASIKYAQLESVFTMIFALATDIPSWTATMVEAKCGAGACVQLAYQALPSPETIGPPTGAVSEIRYFLAAFERCTENRNHLMHSTMMYHGFDEGEALLYKTSKQGKVVISTQPLAKMQQVADDMEAYIRYGRALVNALSARRPESSVPVAFFPWPDRPPPPHSLDYTSDSIPRGRTRPIS